MLEILDEATKRNFTNTARTAQQRDFGDIAKFLQRRGIKKLFHFTHISNLESILLNGFRTRQFLDFSNTMYRFTDPDRFDNFKESISFSIGEPNRLLLPAKNSELGHQLVLLEVSSNSLLTQNFAAFPSNAASGHYQSEIRRNPQRYIGIRALKGLYLNNELRDKAKLPVDVPTDTQAEILFFDPLEPEKIQKVHISPHFPMVMRPTVEKLRSNGGLPKFELVCECGIFQQWTGIFRRYDPGWENDGK